MSDFTKNPEKMNARKISLDESFNFECTECGNCCRGRKNENSQTGIFLSVPDIERISSLLDITSREVIDKYTIKYQDPDLGILTCMLKFKYSGCCIFLKNGSCMVYKARPRTCALYPLGRGIFFVKKKGVLSHYEDNYFINEIESVYKCKNTFQYTVRDWLAKNNIPVNDEEDINWFMKMSIISEKAKKVKKRIDYTENTFDILYGIN